MDTEMEQGWEEEEEVNEFDSQVLFDIADLYDKLADKFRQLAAGVV